ncbi:mitotic interactor and substrate of PLK1 isoform X2 [Dromaius novaehollandiae]|uniref:mitotic interactor and substrate of PLK1 isoform X2 n=1 Tax=Dromaius novaehollandiae TaxID=8790 RepID=UPI00311FE371
MSRAEFLEFLHAQEGAYQGPAAPGPSLRQPRAPPPPWPRRSLADAAQAAPRRPPGTGTARRRLPPSGQQDPAFCSEGLQVTREPEGNLKTNPRPRVQEKADGELDADSSQEMDRVTRHLVFQYPQAPNQDYNDGYQASSSAEQRAGGDDDVFGSSQRSSQRVENGYEWKFRSKSPSNFLDGGKDVWTPSPDRDSRLEVVRSGSLYDLRAYRGERKPSKLYEEDEEEQRRVLPPSISPEKAKELEDERREVIQSQVMKKSSTMAEKWSSMDELSSINPGSGSQGGGRHKGSFTSSFAVYFDKPSQGRAATPVDPENIDTEQINFSAARQQFLMLERTNPDSIFSPRQQAMSPKPESVTRISAQEWHGPETAAKTARGYSSPGAPGQSRTDKTVYQVYNTSYKAPAKDEVYAPRRADTERSYLTGRTSTLTKASSRDDPDSGLGEMYTVGSVGYVGNGSTTIEIFDAPAGLRAGGNGPDKEMRTSNETPIEREIRLAMEREENLWKERGIQRLTSSSELVEIQTKPLLSVSVSPLPARKGKDKGRTSFYVQREIEQETKREEDLKKEGRLLGLYDRGTQQELDERKKVFQQEEAPPAPQQTASPWKADEYRSSWINGFALEQSTGHSFSPTQDARGGKAPPNYTVKLTQFQAHQPRFAAAAGEKSGDEPLMYDRASAGANKWASEDSWGGRLPGAAQRSGSTLSPVDTGVLRKEYFSLPFWKPKVSFVDNMGTQSPLRRERGLEGEGGQEEQYTLRTWKPQTLVLIEKEIQSDLQREEELQEQRRRRQLIDGYSLVSSSSFPKESSHSRLSSQSSVCRH